MKKKSPRPNRKVLAALLELKVDAKHFVSGVLRSNAYAYIRRANKRQPDWVFTTRAVEGGCEIWRVK